MTDAATPAPRRRAAAGLRDAFGGRGLDLAATAVTVVAVAVALRSFVLAPLTGSFTGTFEDFNAYWDAATSSAAGQSPYSTFDPGTMTMSGFIYPPFAAVLVRPLALLDKHAAATLFLWIGLAALLAGAVIVARTVLPESWPRARLGVIAALSFAPATFNLWHGQANPVIFLMLALALRSWVRGDEVRCGVLLGVAAAIKLSPVVLVVLLVRRRWWRGTAAMAGTAAAASLVGLVVMGAGATRTWLTVVLPDLGRDNGWILNQTAAALVNRAADHSVLVWEPASAGLRLVGVALSLVCLGAAAWAVRPGAADASVRGVEFGGGIAAMVLAGSIAWFAHDVHMLIPLLALAGFAARRGLGDARAAVAAVLAGAVVLAVLMPELIAATSMGDLVARSSGGLGWWLYLQLWSLPVLAAAGLLAASAHAARAGRAPAARTPA